jgi:hypothetical protein
MKETEGQRIGSLQLCLDITIFKEICKGGHIIKNGRHVGEFSISFQLV